MQLVALDDSVNKTSQLTGVYFHGDILNLVREQVGDIVSVDLVGVPSFIFGDKQATEAILP